MATYGVDQRYRGSGLITPGICGEAVPRGAAVYMSALDGLWYLADSDVLTTLPAVGIVIDGSRVVGNRIQILLIGLISRSDWGWTRGDPLYVSGTPGVLTHTPPGNAQPVAIAITATQIYVNPALSPHGLGFGGDPDFFPAPNPDSYIGQHGVMQMLDGVDTTILMDFTLPLDFNITTWSVDVLLIPGGTGNLRRAVTTDFGLICAGEAYNANQDTIAAGEVAVTANEVECLDITAALTGSTPLDLVGMEFTRYGSHANDTVNAVCYFVGVVIRRP